MMPLTDHEAEQVRAIALWKSERASLLLESYRSLTRPLSKLVARVVPRGLAQRALAKVESMAEYREIAADLVEAGEVAAVPTC